MLRTWAVHLLVVVACTAGCRGTGTPQIFGPGSAQYQQHRAQQFDPYPETNIGPRVDGGRPDGYTAPSPEVLRGTTNKWTMPPIGR